MSKKILRMFLAGILSALLLLSLFPLAALAANKTVVSFAIDKTEAPAYYLEGDTFSPQGYKGILIYSDGSTENIPSNQLLYQVETPLCADTSVTFSCAMSEQTQTVPIKVLGLDSLVFEGTYQEDYYGGLDAFVPAGLSFRAIFKGNVGSTLVTTSTAVAIQNLTMRPAAATLLSSKDKSVFFTYSIGNHQATVPVPVNVKAVQSLTVKNVPAGPFYEGLPLVYDAETQVQVEALYAGETQPKAIPTPNIADIEKPIRPNVNSEAIYTVSLDGVTQTFTVPVVALRDVTASSQKPFQDIYLHKNNTFSAADITVTASYTDGTSKNVTDDTQFLSPEANVPFQAGDTVSAYFAGRKLNLDQIVKVHSAAIEAASAPTKTTYNEGEHYDTAGFAAIIRYDDGTIYNPNKEVILQVNDPLQVSDAYATYSWNGLTYKQPISVRPTKGVTLRIVTPPEKLSYKTNEPLSLKGLVVSMQRDGDPASTVLSSGMYTTIPAENAPITDDITEIIIRYSLSDTVYYDVKQPIHVISKIATGIAPATQPTKLNYYEGQVFNPDGLTLSLVYSDQTVITITEGFEVPTDPLLLTRESDAPQEVSIPVTYGGMKCTIPITVISRRVDRMEVFTQPVKKEYEPGEFFDANGMLIALYFADDPAVPVLLTQSSYSYAPMTALAPGATEIVITFRDMSVSCPIFVSGTPEDITTEPTPVSTEEPPITTEPQTPVTTEPRQEQSSQTPQTSPTPITTQAQTTGGDNTGGSGGPNGLLILWIVIIVIILGGLVALIIYYKRNFT